MHFAACRWPTKAELRELQHAAQIAADALIRIQSNGYVSAKRIDISLNSLEQLLEQSSDAIARSQSLFSSRDILHRLDHLLDRKRL